MRTDTPPVHPPAFLHSVSTASRSAGDDIGDPTWPASAVGCRWCLRMSRGKAPEFFAPSSLPLLMPCCLRSHSRHWTALLNLKRVVSPPSPTPPLSLHPHLSPSELLQFRVQGEVGQRQSQSLSLSATPSPAISDQAGWEGVVQCSRSGGSSLLPAGEGRLLLPRPGHTHSREIAGLQRSGSDDWTWPSLV